MVPNMILRSKVRIKHGGLSHSAGVSRATMTHRETRLLSVSTCLNQSRVSWPSCVCGATGRLSLYIVLVVPIFLPNHGMRSRMMPGRWSPWNCAR